MQEIRRYKNALDIECIVFRHKGETKAVNTRYPNGRLLTKKEIKELVC